jgi:hypothetical protein
MGDPRMRVQRWIDVAETGSVKDDLLALEVARLGELQHQL